jgi:monoamine oxidase
VARGFRPGGAVTGWAQDAHFLGAYTHAKPGAAGARQVLREAALAGGRLRFAGEACHPSHAATLGGAWASGIEAARAVAQVLRSPA